MQDLTVLWIGIALAVAGTFMLVVFARAIRRAAGHGFFGNYMAIAMLVVIYVGFLMSSSALLIKGLMPIFGGPFIALALIAVVQGALVYFATRTLRLMAI